MQVKAFDYYSPRIDKPEECFVCLEPLSGRVIAHLKDHGEYLHPIHLACMEGILRASDPQAVSRCNFCNDPLKLEEINAATLLAKRTPSKIFWDEKNGCIPIDRLDITESFFELDRRVLFKIFLAWQQVFQSGVLDGAKRQMVMLTTLVFYDYLHYPSNLMTTSINYIHSPYYCSSGLLSLVGLIVIPGFITDFNLIPFLDQEMVPCSFLRTNPRQISIQREQQSISFRKQINQVNKIATEILFRIGAFIGHFLTLYALSERIAQQLKGDSPLSINLYVHSITTIIIVNISLAASGFYLKYYLEPRND